MQSKPPSLVVIGSANTDMIIQLDHLPRPGETILGGCFSTAPGGKGANQAVAAARAGGRVTLVACVGRDSLGREALAGYRRDRINTTHVRRDSSQPSGVALIFVARGGENCIAVAPGANHQLTPADVQRAEKTIAGARAVILQLEIPLPTVRAAIQLARRHRVPVILNPAPAQHLPGSLLSQIDLLTPNETEAEMLTGIRVRQTSSAIRAAQALRARGVGTVILTLGARGALVATGEGEELVPGFKVKAVDTTAAGDVFNGALAVALGEGQPLVTATRFACAAAALSVTRLGAQPSAPKRRQIDALLRS